MSLVQKEVFMSKIGSLARVLSNIQVILIVQVLKSEPEDRSGSALG